MKNYDFIMESGNSLGKVDVPVLENTAFV